MRHLIAIPVSLIIFEKMFTEGEVTRIKCTKGLPKDAKLVNSFYDGWRQTTLLVYEHESFPAIGDGEYIPQTIPEFEDIDILPSILAIGFRCENCSWAGVLYDCLPDVDGDGSPGCPKCGTIATESLVID